MNIDDFHEFGIIHITPVQVTSTGAHLDNVSREVIIAADMFCTLYGRDIHILSLTTGSHSSRYHKDGTAIDWAFSGTQKTVDPYKAFKCAIGAGFRGIGQYFGKNKVFSFHGDLRKHYAFWGWRWSHTQNTWIKGGIYKDPREL